MSADASLRSGWEVVRRVEVRRLERREGMGGFARALKLADEVGREGDGGGFAAMLKLEDLSWRSSSS